MPESVTARLNLRRMTSGSSSTSTVPCSLPPVVDILRSGSCRSRTRAPTSGMRCSGTTSRSSPKRALNRAATSRMSSRCSRWSSPTGTSAGAVGEHVGRLEHRVEEQPGRDELALLRGLVAELVHAVQLAERGDRAQQPAQLGVLLHVALAEQHAALGVQAGGDEDRGGVVDALAQLARVVGDRDRVQVDDAVDRGVAAVLALDVLPDGPDVVARGACAPWAGCRRRSAPARR